MSSSAQKDSKQTKGNTSKASKEDRNDLLDETPTIHQDTVKACAEENIIKYIISRLVGHQQTSRKTYFRVCWYRYDPGYVSYDLESQITTHFVTRHWHSNTGQKPDNPKHR